jgi:multicomponent Na+:H+ antiporter subunit G
MAVTAQSVLVAVLLAFAVLLTAACCLGVLLMESAIDRLHYLGPVTGLAMPAVAVAVMIQESPISASGAKAVLIALALLVSSPVLSHAIGRAHRIRTRGDWRVRDSDKLEDGRP